MRFTFILALIIVATLHVSGTASSATKSSSEATTENTSTYGIVSPVDRNSQQYLRHDKNHAVDGDDIVEDRSLMKPAPKPAPKSSFKVAMKKVARPFKSLFRRLKAAFKALFGKYPNIEEKVAPAPQTPIEKLKKDYDGVIPSLLRKNPQDISKKLREGYDGVIPSVLRKDAQDIPKKVEEGYDGVIPSVIRKISPATESQPKKR